MCNAIGHRKWWIDATPGVRPCTMESMTRASTPRPHVVRRLGTGGQILAALAVGVVLVGGGLVPNARAVTPDPSNVVLVLDFSASILEDKTTRNRFGGALERIADRVDETSADLVAGDTTVTLVHFATRAADYPSCSELKLLNSPDTVARFANCLRSVAAAYRKGLTSALTKRIGVDTNYVAAMEQAAKHLPVGAARPAMILFTDGQHDVAGVPVSQVQPALERLFGSRSPFALLPVGMGLDPKKRDALAAGLERLKIVRDMPACISGATFDWPQVVFQTADEAGNAVAVALQDATCTFTAAPTPSPKPVPTPAPILGIRLNPGDGRVDLSWTAAAANASPAVIDYTAHCRAGDAGDWIESTEGVSTDPSASITGLTNGTAYQCEVAAVGALGPGAWTAAIGTVTPFGRPAPPAKPSVAPLNRALLVGVTPQTGVIVTKYRIECSPDQGATWADGVDVGSDSPTVQMGNLANGTAYVCRAFAANAIGLSDPSPLSDAIKPCGSTLECNSALVPLVGGLGLVLIGGILVALFLLFRGRSHGHVVAVIDVVHTANIGHGSKLGIAMVRAPTTRAVTGIVADRGKTADLKIRRLRGGRFEVRDKISRHVVESGETVVIIDSVGARHALVLRAFATNAASRVASRR